MKRARVLFLITRVHGRKAHLLEENDMIRLLSCKSVAEMSDLLLGSDYSAELSRVSTEELTASQLERIFHEKLCVRWYSLIQTVSGRMQELLEAYCARFEIENLKKIIRALHGNERANDEQFFDIPRKYQQTNLRALRLAKTMPEMVNLLQESSYKFTEEQLADYERYRNPVVLERPLDELYFQNVWAATDRISGSEKIRNLIGTEVDLGNLQSLIRSKYLKLETQITRDAIINLRYRLHKSAVSKLVNADIQEIPRLVTWPSYSGLLKEAVELVEEEKIVDVENLFLRYFYSYVEKASFRNPNSLVYVFYYMHLCQREAKNLASLAIGKEMKMSEEKLRSLLLL